MRPRLGPGRLARRITLVFSVAVLSMAGIFGVAVELYLSRALVKQSELRALSLAESLAAVAQPFLVHYDYISLQQMADAVRGEPDVTYVVLLDKESKVAGFGGRRELQGTEISGLANQRALSAPIASSQRVEWSDPQRGEVPVVEGIAPVRLAGEDERRWGTVRVGLSLAPVRAEVWRARIFLILVGMGGVLGAMWASSLLARRITAPLARLVQAATRLESGASGVEFVVEKDDEIGELATRFGEAARSLDRQKQALVSAKEELTTLNANLEQEVQRRTAELSTSREQYRLLVEGSPDAFVLLEGGRFVFANQAFTKIFQYQPDSVLRESFRWTQIVHPNSHRIARDKFRDAEESGEGFLLDLVGLTRTGKPVDLEVRGRGVRLRGTPALELVLSDVTEKRRLLRQVVQSERLRAMGEMTAMVAHHFNNLLAIMLGRSQLLQMKTTDETVRAGLQVIQASALRAGEMLRHLQEYYGEQVDLRFGGVDLNALLRDLAQYQESIWRTTRPPEAPIVSIRLELDPVPEMRGSDPLLQDAIRRLLANSAEAMPQGGEIVVRTHAEGDEIEVTVEDPGVGMPADVASHAFEPFYTTKGPHTRGLGLSAALGIVQRHEGRIEITSEIGRGTSVSIRLPVRSRIARIVPLPASDGGLDPASAAEESPEEKRA